MKFKLLTIWTVLSVTILSCRTVNEDSIHQRLDTETDRIFEKLVKVRRNFHQLPELAGEEITTSRVITKYLLDLGLEVKADTASHGVIGILKGKENGKSIAWRADMDAITGTLNDPATYKSTVDGIIHGCGHDVHMAIGLGIAEVLAKNKDMVNGTVYFIFQPEEETFNGAKDIVNSDVFSEMNLNEIYALHVTALPVGQIMVKPDELYAYQKRVQLTFENTASKADIEMLHKDLQKSLLRVKDGTKPWEHLKVFDTEVGISNPNTFFKDYRFMEERFDIAKNDDKLLLKTFIYETKKSKLPGIIPIIESAINDSALKDSFIELSYIKENPTVINDKRLTNKSITVLNEIYGKETVVMDYGQIPYFNDDFIYFQEQVPGVYFLLGGSNIEKGISSMNHTPNFAVDEECIRVGVKSFASLILERLSSN